MERPLVIDDRQSGNTTRLVDYYIQKLFNEGTTGIIIDHPNISGSRADMRLLKLITDRLIREHSKMDKPNKGGLKIDTHDRIITLLK